MRIDILTLDVPTPAGRIFTAECVNEAIKKFEGSQVLGELGLSNNSVINFERVSHQVTDLRVEDGKLTGEMRIIKTPLGDTLNTLMKSGVDIKFTPRGYGEVDIDGVVRNYEILSIDAFGN